MLLVFFAAMAIAQASAPAEEPAAPMKAAAPLDGWSADLLDPSATSSLHLLTRGMTSDGRSVVSGSSAWALEARARVRLTEGIAVFAVVPLAVRAGAPEVATHAFFGNLGFGGSVGGLLSEGPGTRFRLSGGLDVYVPTAAEPVDEDVLRARIALAAMRSYEPQLFVPKMMSARVRGHLDVTAGIFTGEVELGLVPGYRLDGDGRFALLFGASSRASLNFGSVVPYLELGGSLQIAGQGEIAPPFLLTPGVRFHFAEVFDPAIFFSFNFVESSAVIVGVDLAHAFRPSTGPKPRAVQERDSTEDFLDF